MAAAECGANVYSRRVAVRALLVLEGELVGGVCQTNVTVVLSSNAVLSSVVETRFRSSAFG